MVYGCELHRCRTSLGIASSENWWCAFSQATLSTLQVPLYSCNQQDGLGHLCEVATCTLHDDSDDSDDSRESVEALEAYQGKHREVLEGTLLERLRLALSGKKLQRGSVEQTE